MEPEILAGPLTTEYVMAPFEGEVALTGKGADPKVSGAMLAKAKVGAIGATLKLVVAVAAK